MLLVAVACGEQAAAPDPTFAAEHAPGSGEIALARDVADRWIEKYPADTLAWKWGEGTLLAGVSDLYRVTGEARYRDYVARYLEHWAEHDVVMSKSDDCIPVITAVESYREQRDGAALGVVDDMLQYLAHDAHRTRDGGISHFGTSTEQAPTLWVDSLFMFGTVLNRWDETDEDTAALDLYGGQLRIFARHLQKEEGFFQHAYDWPAKQDAHVFWGRGNGWVLSSGMQYLRAKARQGERDPEAESIVGKLAAAVVSAQDPETGLFWTVVNRPGETYLETSATALFAAGLARGYRAGRLEADVLPVIKRAIAGIRTRIARDESGRAFVTGISGATSPGTFADYAAIPLEDDLDFGVGVVLLALIEASGLP